MEVMSWRTSSLKERNARNWEASTSRRIFYVDAEINKNPDGSGSRSKSLNFLKMKGNYLEDVR